MTRLVVEEGGKRRAFKVGDGVITIGSGAGATLKLVSTKVAEVHAEIVVQGGVVTVRPRPGVLPPMLKGRPQSAEFTVPKGSTVVIGDAKLTVDPPDPAAAPVAPPPVEREEWQRSSRELYKDRGLKPQHVLLIASPIVIVLGLVIWKYFPKPAASPIAAQVQIHRAEDNIKSAMYEQALADLDKIDDPASLDAPFQARIAELRAAIDERMKESAKDSGNALGTLYLESQILKFETDRLKGKVDAAAARVFLKRLDEFQRRWPSHPEIEAVKRKRERYVALVDLSKPPTYDDIAFEIEVLTWGRKGDYAQGIKILQGWIETVEGEPRAKGLVLLDKTIAARDANFPEVMLEARHQYEKGQIGQAVEWLAILICNSGDKAMADKAAEELLKFEQAEPYLRGYKVTLPDMWQKMAANAVIANWMAEKKVKI